MIVSVSLLLFVQQGYNFYGTSSRSRTHTGANARGKRRGGAKASCARDSSSSSDDNASGESGASSGSDDSGGSGGSGGGGSGGSGGGGGGGSCDCDCD